MNEFRKKLGILGLAITLTCSIVLAGGDGKFHSASNAIPGRYIVVLKDGMLADPAVEEKEVGKFGGHVVKYYPPATLNGYVMTVSKENAIELSKRPNVAFIEQDSMVSIAGKIFTPKELKEKAKKMLESGE